VRLAEAGGRVFDLAEARGTVVLFFLGFTHCPDVCPLTLARFAQARRALGADTARVRFVFVTVDPERDTPEVAKAYANRFDSTIVALSGPRATIDSVQAAFRATSYREAGVGGQGAGGHAGHGAAGGGAGDTGRARGATSTSAADSVYTVVHPARVYVVDTSGQWRLILPAQATAETMLADVRRLLREAR
jgi:protein SCO1/2